MNYTKFTEAYKQVITESNDSELRNYIRSIVEEVLSLNEVNKFDINKQEFPNLLKAINIIRKKDNLDSVKSYTVNKYGRFSKEKMKSADSALGNLSDKDLKTLSLMRYPLSMKSDNQEEETLRKEFIENNKEYLTGLKLASSFLHSYTFRDGEDAYTALENIVYPVKLSEDKEELKEAPTKNQNIMI